MSVATWVEVLQWATIVGLALMVAGLLYQVTDLQRRLGPDFGALTPSDGLDVGAPAPELVAEDARTGRPVSLGDFGNRPVVLAFLSPTCRPCRELVPHLNQFARRYEDTPVVVVATNGDGFNYPSELSPSITVVRDPDRPHERAFVVKRTPLVYLLDEERRVANRTISNSLVDLETTVEGLGRPQGSANWVEVET